MDESDAKQTETCPFCYSWIIIEAEDEIYICPVCRRFFTDEDILLAIEKESN